MCTQFPLSIIRLYYNFIILIPRCGLNNLCELGQQLIERIELFWMTFLFSRKVPRASGCFFRRTKYAFVSESNSMSRSKSQSTDNTSQTVATMSVTCATLCACLSKRDGWRKTSNVDRLGFSRTAIESPSSFRPSP